MNKLDSDGKVFKEYTVYLN